MTDNKLDNLEAVLEQLASINNQYSFLAEKPSLDEFEKLKIRLSSVQYSLVDLAVYYRNEADRQANIVKYVKAKFFEDTDKSPTAAKVVVDSDPQVAQAVRKKQDIDSIHILVSFNLKFAYELWSRIFQSVSVNAKSAYVTGRTND